VRKLSIVLLAAVILVVANTAMADIADPIRYYGMNETVNPSTGTTAVDSAGNQNGTYAGATGPVVGGESQWTSLYGTAATFSGSDDGVHLGAGLGSLTDDFSVAMWIKPSAMDTWQGLICGDDWTNRSWGLMFGSSNKLVLTTLGGDLADPGFLTSGDIGKWTHVAFTYHAATGAVFYKNGVYRGTANTGHSITANSTTNFNLGYSFDGPSDANYGGGMDEVRIYNHILSDSDVARLATTSPEPSTIVLLITGVFGLLAYAWRKRK
jgi:hypothetical protein